MTYGGLAISSSIRAQERAGDGGASGGLPMEDYVK